MQAKKLLQIICIMSVFSLSLCLMAQVPDVVWGVQFGTSGTDFPLELESDADGNVYVVGSTTGDLNGENAGAKDGFLVMFDGSGNQKWARQFGTSSNDIATGIVVDYDKHIVIVGQTMKTMGTESFGSTDIFVAKLDTEGSTLWLQQIGSSKADIVNRVVTDQEDHYLIIGKTTGTMGESNAGGYDVFIMKLDKDGNQQWVRQFGTEKNDEGLDLTLAPNGDIYVCGITTGSFDITALGNEDAFVARLDAEGQTIWVRQFGSNSQDQARGLSLDKNGNVYVGGWTGGVMGAQQYGGGDAFLAYYDKGGNQQWVRQFGTGNWDGAHGMYAFQDGSGDALIGGCWTWPACHGWMRRYNNEGDLIWEKLIYNSASKASCGQTVFIDKSGNCYHIGGTDDNLYTTNLGSQDAFLVKISTTAGVQMNHISPDGYHLFQNIPNPFNPETDIYYMLPADAQVRLMITDLVGQSIITLVNTQQTAGIHKVHWNAMNASGLPVSSGIYVYHLISNQSVEKGKMLLIR